ncbi:MAG TPA: N-methyl-L-tryptophan oxidase [Chitinophagaceae bacterium]|jgi:sarcosine oxidase|nr:N-methyl-L-tryptophan oxidase [Chitinophagaceae bacterium]
MNNSFDVIVIGVGSMGSSACYYLSQRGYKILGLEQFDIVHEFGAHAGQSRIIRKAYFENSNYVPLLERAYENWKALEAEANTQLYFQTGLLYFGSPSDLLIKGIKQSAALYNIPLENLTSSSATKRFPPFKIPNDFEVLLEPDAGFVTPEKAILLYTEQAIKKGAKIHVKEKVIEWKKDGNGVIVTTDKNTYRSNKLVITAGAWAGKIIPGIADKIKITRQFVAWIKPKEWEQFSLQNFPCWLMSDDTKPGCYYGFPILPVATFGGPIGLKLAHHHPALETDPDHVNRETMQEDEEDLKYVLDKYLPGCFEKWLSSKICLYANSPDEDFIIDKLPGYEDQVAIACGFSGHGFKFASVFGEILADLAIADKTELPIEFLSAKRFLKAALPRH